MARLILFVKYCRYQDKIDENIRDQFLNWLNIVEVQKESLETFTNFAKSDVLFQQTLMVKQSLKYS